MQYKAHFLNVGCADCTIFEMDNDLVLIDCGYRRFGNNISKPTIISDYINYNIGKTYIDLLIISHPHHDHFLGMEELIWNFTVAEFWGTPYKRRYGDNSISKEEWNEYQEMKNTLVPDNKKRFIVTKGAKKEFSKCVFSILGPRENINLDSNRECHDACLVVWISTPAYNFIICGDASDSELDQIRQDWKLSECSVLRASHHGSINGANLDFIKSVSPTDTIISTKSGIIDNLPDNKALKRYKDNSNYVFRTDIDGTLTTPLII